VQGPNANANLIDYAILIHFTTLADEWGHIK